MTSLFPWSAEPAASGDVTINPTGTAFPWEAPTNDPVTPEVVQQDPNKLAEERALAKQAGVEPSAVRDAADQIKAGQRVNAINDALKDSPATRDFLSNPDNAALAHDVVENLTGIERLARSFQRGAAARELGYIAGVARETSEEEASLADVQRVRDRLKQLGEDTGEGLAGYLSPAAEVLGQFFSNVTSGRTVAAVAEGAVIGAGAGAIGSLPGVAVGAAVGAGAGFTANMMLDSFEVEGGNAYIEMREQGVPMEDARVLSYGVGILNAGLEMVSEAVIAKPFVQAVKPLIKEAITGPVVAKALKEAGKAYGAGIVAETATEVAQELVQISAEEWGKNLSGLEGASREEIVQRVEEIAVKTLQATSVLAAPGAGVSYVSEARKARQANKDQEVANQLAQAIQASPLTERAPDVAADHVSTVLKETGKENAFIPAERLAEWAQANGIQEHLVSSLGVPLETYEEALALGQDVKVPASALAQFLMTHQDYANLSEHVKFDEDGLTPSEAKEFSESGVLDAMARAPIEENVSPETPPAILTAAADLGLKPLFQTAAEAGMSPKDYESYLKSIDDAQQESAKKFLDRKLKAEQQVYTADWKAKRNATEAAVTEEVNSTPVYKAFQALDRRDRLDRDLLEAMLPEGIALKNLPKHGTRTIYNDPKAEGPGIDPAVFAELHDYSSVEDMIMDMLTVPKMKDRITELTDKRMREQHGQLHTAIQQIQAARKDLATDRVTQVLLAEVDALRKMAREARPKAERQSGPRAKSTKTPTSKIIRQAAILRIQNTKMQDISVEKFFVAAQRAAKNAGKAVRANDLQLAADYKLQQAINLQMAKQAERHRLKAERMRKYMARFTVSKKAHRSFHPKYLEAIRKILNNIRLRGAVKPREAVSNFENNPVRIDTKTEQMPHWREMAYSDFKAVHDDVKAIHEGGLKENKIRENAYKTGVDSVVAEIVVNLEKNTKQLNTNKQTQNLWEKVRDGFREYAGLVLNVDTLLREIDGFEDLGAAHSAIKGRYDRAVASGYMKGMMGLNPRRKAVSQKYNEIFDRYFTKTEKLDLSKRIKIPGVNQTITKNEMLSVLLNSGNDGNSEALRESKRFTDSEIIAIRNFATKKDWDFAQEIWDFVGSFWPEVVDAEQRRRNVTPKEVQAIEIVTPYGTYKGGYYPIRYDKAQNLSITNEELDQLFDAIKYGERVNSQTAHGHTMARKSANGKKLLLDLHVIGHHLDDLVYDLEMGDVVHDIYKILHHKDLMEAFNNHGQKWRWDALKVWLADQVASEQVGADIMSRSLRWVRAGFVVSKLAMNVSVALLQPLGLIQTAVAVGKVNTLKGIHAWMHNPYKARELVNQMSSMMSERDSQWNKDLTDARTQLSGGWFERLTPGKSSETIKDLFFFAIKYTQGGVDTITWLSAHADGIKKFDGDAKKAVEYADLMVRRSQGSGVFGDRSSFERGTWSNKIRQNELVKTFTALASFFIAKNNVFYEKVKKTNYTSPAEMGQLLGDFLLLYSVEAIAVGLLQNRGLPEDEDDEGAIKQLFDMALKGTVSSIAGGFPGFREFVSEASGFRGGGVTSELIKTTGNIWKQATGEGELDASKFVRTVNDLGGMLLHYPSAAINKAIRASEQEDSSFLDYLLGPVFKENK